MDPSACLMALATPPFCWADWKSAGHVTVLAASSFHVSGAAFLRYFVNVSVVPELSARRTTLMSPAGRVAPGLSVLIASSLHFLMSPWKIFARVVGDSWSLSRPPTLYDTVMGAATVGK